MHLGAVYSYVEDGNASKQKASSYQVVDIESVKHQLTAHLLSLAMRLTCNISSDCVAALLF